MVNTLSDAVGPITCIRFSPDGNRMAGASLDGNVYIYSVLENFKLEVRAAAPGNSIAASVSLRTSTRKCSTHYKCS